MRTIDADKLKADLLGKSFYPAIVAAAIERMPTVNPYEWISIDERLPTWEDGKVLIYTPYGISIAQKTTTNHWKGDNAIPKLITHWMPLPAPPTEKEN